MEQRHIEIIIEKTARSLQGKDYDSSLYGVGRVLERGVEGIAGNGASRLLTVIDDLQASPVLVPEATCFRVPPSLGNDEALLAVPLAAALRVWDRLQLELGEVAVYTEGYHSSNLIGLAAVWRGGCPVVRLSDEKTALPFDQTIDLSIADPDEALTTLRKYIQDKPGFAAVDVSGKPQVIDLLLEAMPRWGRLMLAGHTQTSLTVDFYNNVHRKGALLICDVFDPASILKNRDSEIYLAAAFRLLEKKDIVEVCTRMVEAKQSS